MLYAVKTNSNDHIGVKVTFLTYYFISKRGTTFIPRYQFDILFLQTNYLFIYLQINGHA